MTERAPDLPSATPDLTDIPPLLDVPGVRNFRDAGITGLRPGLLYRSGSSTAPATSPS
jgi:protein-tyrosine phosphatase